MWMDSVYLSWMFPCRKPWMKPPIHGASRWSGLRSRTWSCPARCRERWLQRPRPAARPERRLRRRREHRASFSSWCTWHNEMEKDWWLSPCVSGDRRRGRDEGLQGSEGGLSGDCRVSLGAPAALPADPQLHRSREELHHHLPSAHRRTAEFYAQKEMIHSVINHCQAFHTKKTSTTSEYSFCLKGMCTYFFLGSDFFPFFTLIFSL